MVSTVNAHKAGTTTWRAWVWEDNGDDPKAFEGRSQEFREQDLDTAKRWAEIALGESGLENKPSVKYWAEIARGHYEGVEFEDDQHGTVHDASWEFDDDADARWYAYLKDDGTIGWSGQ